MSDVLSKWLSLEAYKHPAFFLLSLISVGIGAGMLANPFVMANDFNSFEGRTNVRLESLEVAVCTVQFSIEKSGLNSQLRAVESEIFQLEGAIEAGTSTARDKIRLVNLKSDKGQLGRDLNILMQREGCKKRAEAE